MMTERGNRGSKTLVEHARLDAAARADERQSIFMLAKLRRDGAEALVRIRNISAGGVMVDSAAAFPLATDALLDVEINGLGQQRARVAWCTGDRVGLAFEQPVDPARVRRPVRKNT